VAEHPASAPATSSATVGARRREVT
jgi:hypothetical protein